MGMGNTYFDVRYAPSNEPLGPEQAQRLLTDFQRDWKDMTLEKSEPFEAGPGLTGLYREMSTKNGYRAGLYWIRTRDGLLTAFSESRAADYAGVHAQIAASLRTLHFNGLKQHIVVIDGFLQGQQHWGRPVDVQQLDDGSLLVSDDQAGAIYRLTYAPMK
jgi:hypothetical protein